MASNDESETIKKPEEKPRMEHLPRSSIRDPTLPTSIPTTARGGPLLAEKKSKCVGNVNGCLNYLYNPKDQTFCERTCCSWFKIIFYSLMYLIFLCTYTLIFLYCSLEIIKSITNFNPINSLFLDEPVTSVKKGVGLTATPTAAGADGKSLIWYRRNDKKDYQKYISVIDELLNSRNRTPELIKSLGPCGKPPYGYGEKPCVIVRINKQLNWSEKPLRPDSASMWNAPKDVQNWVKSGKDMLWLHCDGFDSHDKEHIGTVNYYPYPPGFDPKMYPLNISSESLLRAVQFSDFTLGVSLSIACRLWYENGQSSVQFTLYVAPENKEKKLDKAS